MTVPAELIDRSYYTIIMGIRICVSEKAETPLALTRVTIRGQIRENSCRPETHRNYVHACAILLEINCVRNSNNSVIYIAQATIKEHIIR